MRSAPLALLLALSAPAAAHDVVVFGDSWAEQSGDLLGDVFVDNARLDLTVDNVGVGGSTAMYWNDSEPTALADAVTANPDARWVWLSILGNDTFAHHSVREGDLAAGRNEAELRAMLDGLFAVHPDIQVVMFAYDYLNFEQSETCILTAAIYFPDLLDTGPFTTQAVHDIFERDIAEVQAAVAADHPQVTALTLWGTLQAAGGMPTAPDPALPSPASLMGDCIHPTTEGYTALHQALYDAYWGLPEPAPALPEGPLGACVGETLTAALSDPASDVDRTWTADGQSTGDGGASLLLEGGAAGTVQVEVTERRGAWAVSDTVDVVFSEPPSGVTLDVPATVCAGGRVSVAVQGAGDAEVTWSPAGSFVDATAAATTLQAPASEGPVPLTATVTTGPGCATERAATVEVVPAPEVALTGPLAADPDTPTPLTVSAPDGAVLTWAVTDAEGDPTDAATVVQGPAGTATFTAATEGTYTVRLTVQAGGGCTLTTEHTLLVAPGTGSVVDPPPGGCAGAGCAVPRRPAGPRSGAILLGLALLVGARRRS